MLKPVLGDRGCGTEDYYVAGLISESEKYIGIKTNSDKCTGIQSFKILSL